MTFDSDSSPPRLKWRLLVFELIDCTVEIDDLVNAVEELKRVKRCLDWLAQFNAADVQLNAADATSRHRDVSEADTTSRHREVSPATPPKEEVA